MLQNTSTSNYVSSLLWHELGNASSLVTLQPARNATQPHWQQPRIAVCVLGLERTLDRILNNTIVLLSHFKQLGRVHVFGVEPAPPHNWKYVPQLLKHSGLLQNASIEAQVIRSDPAPPRYIPHSSARGFMIELNDCAHCGRMIRAMEAAQRWVFDVIARVRLDLFWEVLPPMPTTLKPNEVHVPRMSHCRGVDDKFAVGGRLGMEAYLMRVERLQHFPRNYSFNSERFLGFSLRHVAAVRHHYDWMFCKFGRVDQGVTTWFKTTPNMWLECSIRITRRTQCERLSCAWCGQGCRCWNNTCSIRYKKWNKEACHELPPANNVSYQAERTSPRHLPGLALEPAKQLLLS